MSARNEIATGFIRGFLSFQEKGRHVPAGSLFNAAGSTVISFVVAHIFAHDQIGRGGRFEFIVVAFFAFLILQTHFFSAFGESWRDKRHILSSNFSLLEISLSHVFSALAQTAVFLAATLVVFGTVQPYLLFALVFICWVVGLRQVAYVSGGYARWVGRVGTILGRAFFILSPIVWIPVNDRQMVLSDYNPLVILLGHVGIRWDGRADLDHMIVLACIPPLLAFALFTRAKFRRWLCERLY